MSRRNLWLLGGLAVGLIFVLVVANERVERLSKPFWYHEGTVSVIRGDSSSL